MNKPAVTLYQIADREIRSCIVAYLKLAKETTGLSRIEEKNVADERTRTILLAGLGITGPMSAKDAVEEWKRRHAIPFDLETAIAAGVYRDIREAGGKFLESLESSTDSFTKFDPTYIYQNPYLLPLLQHLAGVFSKSALKKQVGQVSDTGISKPAAQRLAKLLEERVDASKVNKGEILQRLESTLEGIVRDLVGRVLLESIVESALIERNVSFQREEDYESLPGVVYDFRADFVVPNAQSPVAFIEVRKSSSRHASLYAKDKMFSAINWKGHNSKMLAVLVIDGEWTGETLRVMAKVFDYVVPISRVAELVQTLADYLAGDESKLKWLIDFKIRDATKSK